MNSFHLGRTTSHDSSLLWDLSKVALTSLALLGVTGCGKTPEQITAELKALPKATPTEVIEHPHNFEGKRISIEGSPRFNSEEVSFYSDGGKRSHTYLQIDGYYTVTDTAGKQFPLFYRQRIDVTGKHIEVKDVAAPYRLHSETVLVAGVVKQDSKGQYFLSVDGSLYSPGRTVQKDE